MWFKKLKEDIARIDNFVHNIQTELNGKASREDMFARIEKIRYEECFNCGCLCNKNRMNPLSVFERDLNKATQDREFVLNGYIMRQAIAALACEEKLRDDTTTTIYFCKNCKAELPKQ